jgi:hypothetical protein
MPLASNLIARTCVAVLVGLVVAFAAATALNVGFDAIASAFALTRDDLIANDRNALLFHVQAVWTGLLVGLALACAVGAVVGAWVVARIAPASELARIVVVGAILLLGAAQAILIIGQPVLVACVTIALFLLCVYISRHLPGRNDAA